MEGTSENSITGNVVTHFVGRENARAELTEILNRTVQYETPQIVTLSGGAGIGKSRLLSSWIAELERSDLDLRILTCAAAPKQPSYALFTSMLERRFQLRYADDRTEALRAQVEDVLLDRRLTEVLHFLGTFLGISVPDNPFIKALEETPSQHDQIARTVLRRFLEMDAQQIPLLLVMEDLQQADERSLSLFRELSETMEGAPIVLLGTFRPELFVHHPDFCELDAEHTHIDLPPLDLIESEEMLRGLLSRVEVIPDQLQRTAVEMAGGNPFFIEELVRVLLSDGTIQDRGDRWTIEVDDVDEISLPVSVEAAVHMRISALDAAERDVLEKAACLGSVFWKESLICFSRLQREVEDKGDLWLADVEHQTIQGVLDGLIERDYLLRMPDSSIPDATEYVFKHNMERELIVNMIGDRRMQQYHLFAAQWLETSLRNRSESQLEYVGQHYAQGGNHRRAAFCFVHAGDRARARYANEQAAVYYRRGLDLLGLDDVLAKIEALHNLGDVCTVLGHHEEGLKYFGDMLHNAWLLDHKAKGGAAHRRIGRIYRTLADYDQALSHLKSAMRLFDQVDDMRGVAATLDDVGQVAWLKGEYDRALEFHRRALTIKRESGTPRAIAVTLNNIGTVHQSSGSFREALECFVEALEIRKEVEDRIGIVDSLINLGRAHRARSDYSMAFELWTEALEMAREIGDRIDEAYLLINLGEAQVQLGKPGAAEDHLRDAVILARDLGDQKLRASCSRVLAEIKLATGDLDGAEREARLAYDIADKLGLKLETGTALRTLAEVTAAHEVDDEQLDQATALFNSSIEIVSSLGNDLELARTFASFADFKDRCGLWEDADHFRASADEIFTRLKSASAGTPER